MRGRLWPAIVAGTVAALTVVAMVPGPAQASAGICCGPIFDRMDPVAFDPATGEEYMSIPDWLVSGSCTMFPDSRVVLTPPDADGQAWAAWHAVTFTNKTQHADIWQGTFGLFDSAGALIVYFQMQSPPMAQTYVDYYWDYYQPIPITATDFARVTQVGTYMHC